MENSKSTTFVTLEQAARERAAAAIYDDEDSIFSLGDFAESPLESKFWEHAGLLDRFDFHQVAAQVRLGRYRVDSLFTFPGDYGLPYRVAIELDGKRFHDEQRDAQRDDEILAANQADEIIRIPYAAMWYSPDATFACLQSWHRQFEIPQHIFVMHASEIEDELEQIPPEDFANEESAMEWAKSNYEVWIASPLARDAYAASLKAFLDKWNVAPITRRCKIWPSRMRPTVWPRRAMNGPAMARRLAQRRQEWLNSGRKTSTS